MISNDIFHNFDAHLIFLFFCFWKGNAAQNTSQGVGMACSRLQEQVSEVGPPHLYRRNQGVRECFAARAGNHPRPSPTPCEESGTSQGRWSIALGLLQASRASSLQRPPTTTRWHLPPSRSSQHLAALSARLAQLRWHELQWAAPLGLSERTSKWCPPPVARHGALAGPKPELDGPLVWTAMIISLNFALHLTEAPVRGRPVLSVGTTLVLSLPDRGDAARCSTLIQARSALTANLCDQKRQTKSFQHDSTEECRLQCELRSRRTSTQNVGTTCSRVWSKVALSARLHEYNGLPEMVFRSGRKYCQPCGHSRGSASSRRRSSHVGRPTKPQSPARWMPLVLPQTPNWISGHVQDDLSCKLGQQLLEHRQCDLEQDSDGCVALQHREQMFRRQSWRGWRSSPSDNSEVAHESVNVQLEWDLGPHGAKSFWDWFARHWRSLVWICQCSECCQISRCNLVTLQCLPPGRDFPQLNQSLSLCSPVCQSASDDFFGLLLAKLLHMIAHSAASGCATHRLRRGPVWFPTPS